MDIKPTEALFLAGGTGLGLFALYRFFQNEKLKAIESGTVITGENQNVSKNYPVWAKDFEMAFKNDSIIADIFGPSSWGTGTNLTLVMQTVKAIPTQRDYFQVGKAYKTLTKGRILDTDLRDDLSNSEFQEVQKILKAKPY